MLLKRKILFQADSHDFMKDLSSEDIARVQEIIFKYPAFNIVQDLSVNMKFLLPETF
jgi:penicillin-binding protein 2